jgi:hypothetical protein
MSGTVAVGPEVHWSAAGWLFDWVVEFLADEVADPEVAADLREIVAANLGWLGLDDYGPEAGAQLRKAVRSRLLPAAEERLPETLPSRPEVIALLRELVDEVG